MMTMRTVLTCLACLCLMAPASLLAAPTGADSLSSADDERIAAKGKKKKKKKGKKGAEPETPPPPPPDADGDGLPDDSDKCVDAAEDEDGFEDEDGCPDPDNDGDGKADAEDGCPDEAPEGTDADDDGCTDPPPAISPLDVKFELMDGTKVSGRVNRIIAVDEDEPDSDAEEPTGFEVIVNDLDEYETDWSNLRALKSESVKCTEAVDCYSEGVQELGEAPTWECTLKHPTVVTLAETQKKGTHRFLDRKMKRLDFVFETLECEGTSCETVTEDNILSLYFYKLIALEKNEDETGAVTTLQTTLRAVQKRQIKKGTVTPAPVAEPEPEE
jgi:hypothetical protein